MPTSTSSIQDGSSGQLGNGAISNQTQPVLVSGGRAFATIAAGGGHTCALNASGSAWCWGKSPANGQQDNTTEPALVGGSAGGDDFVAVSAHYAASCALDTFGSAFCWGRSWGNTWARPAKGGNLMWLECIRSVGLPASHWAPR